MLTKLEQTKEAASLAEKLTQSIIVNVREHTGLDKKQSELLKLDFVYDEIFDVVVAAYRGADFAVRHPDEEDNDE